MPPVDTGGDWRDSGLCRQDPDPWLEPGTRAQARDAADACRECPVLAQCAGAVEQEIRQGMVPVAVVVAGTRWPGSALPRRRALALLAAADG